MSNKIINKFPLKITKSLFPPGRSEIIYNKKNKVIIIDYAHSKDVEITIDAEEQDRLSLSFHIIKKLAFEKKIAKIALDLIDKTIGTKFPMIDKLTDLFQEQQVLEKKIKDLELRLDALEHFLKDNK